MIVKTKNHELKQAFKTSRFNEKRNNQRNYLGSYFSEHSEGVKNVVSKR